MNRAATRQGEKWWEQYVNVHKKFQLLVAVRVMVISFKTLASLAVEMLTVFEK